MKNKVCIMKTIPEIKDDEIRSYMDFDKLVEMSKSKPVKSYWRSMGKISFILLGLGAIMIPAAWYLSNQNGSKQEVLTIDGLKPQPGGSLLLPDTAMAVHESDSEEEPAQNQLQLMPSSPAPSKDTNADRPKEDVAKETLTIDRRDSVVVESVIGNLYKQAEPADGYTSLYEYFARALSYPQKALKDSIEGVVVVAFTINIQGKPEKITIEQSLGPAFDEESVRVISEMPEWRPATYNEKPVASRISVPLTFQLSIKPND